MPAIKQKKPKPKYNGYNFTTVGHLDKEKLFIMVGKVASTTFGLNLEPVAIHDKDDPNDSRLGYFHW